MKKVKYLIGMTVLLVVGALIGFDTVEARSGSSSNHKLLDLDCRNGGARKLCVYIPYKECDTADETDCPGGNSGGGQE